MKKNREHYSFKTAALGAAILVFGVLVFFGNQTKAQGTATPVPDLGVTNASGGSMSDEQISQMGTQVLALLDELKNIQLDGSIFEDPSFKSLKDYSVEIPSEVKGRSNPFDTIGSVAASSAPNETLTSAPVVAAPAAPAPKTKPKVPVLR